jgi:hypothetical protein
MTDVKAYRELSQIELPDLHRVVLTALARERTLLVYGSGGLGTLVNTDGRCYISCIPETVAFDLGMFKFALPAYRESDDTEAFTITALGLKWLWINGLIPKEGLNGV